MKLVCDTDILSIFAKTGRLGLLEEAFPNAEFSISESVYDELMVSKENGFSFPDRIFNLCKIVTLNEEEIKLYKKLKENPKYFLLSKADLRTLILAEKRNLPLLSNDKHLLKKADKEKVLALDIYDIFKIIYREEILSEQKVRETLAGMEEKDNAQFKEKKKIFE